MNPRGLLLLGAIILSIGNMLGGNSNNSISIGELHTKSTGTYLIHGKCLSKDNSVIMTDSTGSVELEGSAICYGVYGKGLVQKAGSNLRLVKFNFIEEVKSKRYRILKTFNYPDGVYAKVDLESEGIKVIKLIPSYGMSNYVIKTSTGYERL